MTTDNDRDETTETRPTIADIATLARAAEALETALDVLDELSGDPKLGLTAEKLYDQVQDTGGELEMFAQKLKRRRNAIRCGETRRETCDECCRDFLANDDGADVDRMVCPSCDRK